MFLHTIYNSMNDFISVSQLRRGRRQFQKDGLQQKGKNGEKATNSQDKKDEMTKRHYYGDMTPETKHEAIYWFTCKFQF